MIFPMHWPQFGEAVQDATPQGITRSLAKARSLIIAFHEKQNGDWRVSHAQTAPIEHVVEGLIADANAIQELFERCDAVDRKQRDKIRELQDALVEAKRPFTAQMQMQNNRIIALTAEVDRLNHELARTTSGGKE